MIPIGSMVRGTGCDPALPDSLCSADPEMNRAGSTKKRAPKKKKVDDEDAEVCYSDLH